MRTNCSSSLTIPRTRSLACALGRLPSQADAVKLFAAPKIEKKMAFDSVLLPWDKIIPNVKYAPSICEAEPAQLNPNPIPIPNPDPDPNPNPNPSPNPNQAPRRPPTG